MIVANEAEIATPSRRARRGWGAAVGDGLRVRVRDAILGMTLAIPADLVRKMSEMGFLGSYLPEAYGGLDAGYKGLGAVFEQVVRDTLAERGVRARDLLVSFNPELAPQSMLFEPNACAALRPMPARQCR